MAHRTNLELPSMTMSRNLPIEITLSHWTSSDSVLYSYSVIESDIAGSSLMVTNDPDMARASGIY